MKSKITEIHICDYCRKKYLVKSACEKHEKYCTYNIDNQPKCSGCQYLEEYSKEVEIDHPIHGEYERQFKAFRCTKKNIGLYPLKVLKGNMLNRYPGTFAGEEVMPKECELFEFIW